MPKDFELIRNNMPTGMFQYNWELRSLLSVVLSYTDLNSFLEIGAFSGGSLYMFMRYMCPMKGSAFVIDRQDPTLNGNPQDLIAEWHRWVSADQTLDVIYRDSHEDSTLKELSGCMLNRGVGYLDFLFIDGDHSYNGVKQDYEMYSPLVRNGGIIAFHDVAEYGPAFDVPRAWREIRDGKQYGEVIANPKYMGIGYLLVERE